MGRYDQMIAEAEQRHHLPPGLLTHVVNRESAGDPMAVSPKGAQGLTQLMPGTAKELGVTDVHDPAQNIEGGAKYLAQQLDRFKGDVPTALAAYNFGPNAVAAGKEWPAETRHYTDTIMKAWQGNGGGMPTLQQVVADPQFRGLPELEQIKVMERISQDFAGLPPEEKPRALQMTLSQGAKPTAPPLKMVSPDNTAGSDEYWKLFVRGLIKGPVGMAEGAVDLSEQVLQYVGFIDEVDPRNLSQLIAGDTKKITWADSVIHGIEQATGVKLPEAKSSSGRIVERTGEEIGATVATLLPVGFGLRALGFLKTISPARLAMLEGVLATGGGATAGAFRELAEIFPMNPDIADFVGEVIGSLGVTATLGLVRFAKDWATGKRAEQAEKALKVKVGKDLLKATDGDVAGVEQAANNLKAVQHEMGTNPDGTPKFKGTTGGAAKDEPGLTNMEKSFSQTGGGRTVGKDTEFGAAAVSGRFQKRQGDDLTALGERVDEIAPQGDVKKVGEELSKQQKAAGRQQETELHDTLARVEAQRDRVKNDVTAHTQRIVHNTEQRMIHAERRAEDRVTALGSNINDEQRGLILRREYAKELDESERRVTALYNRLDQGIKLPTSHTQAARLAVERGIHRTETKDFIPKGVLDNIKALGKAEEGPPLFGPTGQPLTAAPVTEATFGELDALKKRIQHEYRATDVRNGLLRKRLKELEAGVLQDLDALRDDPVLAARYPQQAQFYDEARQVAFKEIMRLKSGTIDRLRYKDATGRYRMQNEDVAEVFIEGKASMDDLVAALGNRPEALEAVQNELRYQFLKATMDFKHDRIDETKVKRWLFDEKHQAVLNQFPELRVQFTDAAEQTKMAKEARAEYEALRKNPEATARLTNPDLFDRLDVLDQRAARTKQLVERKLSERQIDEASSWLGLDADKAAYSLIANTKTRRTEVAGMWAKVQGNPEAAAGFQKALWDASVSKWMSRAAVDGAGDPALMANKIRMFLLENEDWMTEVFGPDRMASLEKVKEGLAMVSRAKYANSQTTLMAFTAVKDLGPLLGKMAWTPTGLGLFMGKAGYYRMQRWFAEMENEQVASLFQEAFFDPKVARTLMLMAKEDTADRLIRKRLHAHLYNMNQLLEPDQFEEAE
jgi:hypothetical protein